MSDQEDVARGGRGGVNPVARGEFELRRSLAEALDLPDRSNGPAADGRASVGRSDGDKIAPPGSATRSQRDDSEWRQAKALFGSIVAEASGMATMLDQERKQLLGLSDAVSQVDENFERLHNRFMDLEDRVASFESLYGRLSLRLETTLQDLAERNKEEAELLKSNAGLQAAEQLKDELLAIDDGGVRLLSRSDPRG